MRKMLFFVSLFLLTTQAKSEIVWPDVNVSDASISYSGGYLMASLYDVYQISTHKDRDIHKERRGYELAAYVIPIPIGGEVPYVEWKLGLGALAGLMMETHAADRDNRQLNFGNIGWGALGGLTNIIIHF